MLTQLRIVDFAIIEEIELVPGPGLNVLTGETGAGKSIIVEAAALLRGGRASSELCRGGASEATVEALFSLAPGHDARAAGRLREALERAGLPAHGDELSVRRVVGAGGRGRAYLNGNVCTVATLAEIVGQLLDISGQHEHQLLSDRATHRALLDELAPAALVEGMRTGWSRLRAAAEAVARSRMDDRERAARLDYLRYQIEELEAAALRAGEDVELEAERARLQRAGELTAATSDGEHELYGGEGAVTERIARVRRRLEALAPIDARLGPLVQQLDEARAILEDAALSLGRYAAGVEPDPARLDQIEERLDLIRRLKRKHGATLEAILDDQSALRAELAELSTLEARRGELEAELEVARGAAAGAAAALGGARAIAAHRLAVEVTRQLAGLRMAGAKLDVEVAPRAQRETDDPALCCEGRRLGEAGWDLVEFRITTNPGEDARPLAAIASGGELSRIMLALRSALGAHDPVATSIYDEVDAGIGGAVADAVGRALAEVAQHRQVLCVTHLPQVAAYADQHFFVGKRLQKGRAQTTLELLEGERSVEELGRLLGGERVTEQARDNARELRSAARAARAQGRGGQPRRARRGAPSGA